jgi:soluble P-type ATPase
MGVLAEAGSLLRSVPEALNKLKDAVSLLEANKNNHPSYKKLMAITLNNVACYYKQ